MWFLIRGWTVAYPPGGSVQSPRCHGEAESSNSVVLCGTLSARHWSEAPRRPPQCAQTDRQTDRQTTASAPQRTATLSCSHSSSPAVKRTLQTAAPEWQIGTTVAGGPCKTEAVPFPFLFFFFFFFFFTPSDRSVKVQPNSSVTTEQPMNITGTSWRNRAPLIRSGESNRDLRRRNGGFGGPANTRLSSVNVKPTPPPLLLRTCMQPPSQLGLLKLERGGSLPPRLFWTYLFLFFFLFFFFWFIVTVWRSTRLLPRVRSASFKHLLVVLH